MENHWIHRCSSILELKTECVHRFSSQLGACGLCASAAFLALLCEWYLRLFAVMRLVFYEIKLTSYLKLEDETFTATAIQPSLFQGGCTHEEPGF